MQLVAANPEHACPWLGPAVANGCQAVAADALTSFLAAAMAAGPGERALVPLRLDQPEDVEARLAASLSAEERHRAARFRRPRDRRHYIVAHGRLRELLAERLEVRPEHVSLGYSPDGKPGLAGRQAASGWHFNLSYADGEGGGMALCAFSRRGPIGVDLEWVRPLADAEAVARHFLSPGEYASYRRQAPAQRELAFFLGWTRKEALVKALGRGLAQDLAACEVSLDPGRPARILRLGALPGERCGWRLASIGPAGGRVAALVTKWRMD